VTKFILVNGVFWSHFVVLLKYDFGVQQTHLRGQFVEHHNQAYVVQQSVTKLKIAYGVFWSHFVVLFKSTLDVQKT
jgi:hypothetical protein